MNRRTWFEGAAAVLGAAVLPAAAQDAPPARKGRLKQAACR